MRPLSVAFFTASLEEPQLFPPFEHVVSVLDLLFNEGPNAWRYMKSFHSELWWSLALRREEPTGIPRRLNSYVFNHSCVSWKMSGDHLP